MKTLRITLAFIAIICSAFALTADFESGFEDGEGGAEPPPVVVCVPVAPDFPPYNLDGTPPVSLVSLPLHGSDRQTLVMIAGGTWEAYSFTRADMPGDVSTFHADTSNTGGFPGADARTWSISECAGDFRHVPACYGGIGEGPFAYADFTGTQQNTCHLDPAKLYYLNVHMGPAPCNITSGAMLCSFRFVLR